MPAYTTYPRVVTRGPLKGQTVLSKSDHMRRLPSERGTDRPATSGLRGDTVVRIIESYEDLLTDGVSKRRAMNVLQRVFGA